MKYLLKLLLLLLPELAFSQDLIFNQPTPKEADSLLAFVKKTTNDTLKMSAADHLANYYIETNTSLAYRYFAHELTLARKLNQRLKQASALDGLSYVAYQLGNYAESLKFANAGIEIAENSDCEKNVWRVTDYAKDGDAHKARLYVLANLYEKLAYLYLASDNSDKALKSYFKALDIAKSVDDKVGLSFYNGNLADYYLGINKPDIALGHINKALFYCDQSGFSLYRGYYFTLLSYAYYEKKDILTSKKYAFEGLKTDKQQSNLRNLPYAYEALGLLYKELGKTDSGVYYMKLALNNFKTRGDKLGVNAVYQDLYNLYKSSGRTDSAYTYLQRAKVLGDSLNKAETAKLGQYLKVGFNEQLKVEALEKEKEATQSRNRIYMLSAGIAVFMLLALIFYRNNKHKQKANQVLEKTLNHLKATQAQLIQSEKMASLGELTAGIAHEIQNPLNFVNNFSDVNTELIEELRLGIERGDMEEVKAIAFDIQENEKKVNMHGKRADAIVKGMLQHSRASSTHKEPTDLNELADEYLRLAYHGLRAKDKSFNAELVTHFDEKLPLIDVVPQYIGRVILNLLNNAFYAIQQKAKTAGSGYKPAVVVSTRSASDHVTVSVKDNGDGIPEAIKEKIMQPFFTTKPTGEGTGLGLSLSYDIIVKGHNGKININSKEGEGSEFIIDLPIL